MSDVLDPPAIQAPPLRDVPATGTPWCNCGKDHTLDLDRARFVMDLIDPGEGDWVSHRRVVATAAELWQYEEVCQFFLDGIERAARTVHGSVAERYRRDVGCAIAVEFSQHWNGCPQELCDGGISL